MDNLCLDNQSQSNKKKPFVKRVVQMNHEEWSKREPIKNFFPVPNEVFLLGLSPGGTSSVFLPAFLRGQKYLSVLAQLQNHWEGYWNEYQHGAKVCADAGRPGTHHRRGNQYHHEGRSKAKWKSTLHHPSDPGSSGAILPAAVRENILGCAEGKSIGYES